MAEEETPDYEDINMDENKKDDIVNIEDFVDNELDSVPGRGVDDFRRDWQEDPSTNQESIESVNARYRTEADVPADQRESFDAYRGAYGRHAALSNTKHGDNLRHLMAIDNQSIWEVIAPHAQRATMSRIRETSELQLGRGNEERGGFEAKLSATSIRREDVDVKQSQSLIRDNGGKKKKGILGFLRR